MRRIRWSSYVLFLCVFLCVMVVSDKMAPLRSWLIGGVSPFMGGFSKSKEKFLSFFASPTFTKEEVLALMEDLEAEKRENRALLQQLSNVKQWLLHEDRIEEQMIRLKELGQADAKKEFLTRRRAELSQILQLQTQALPARVVYREPCSWSSFFWIDLGHKHNRAVEKPIVVKNSPVVVGNVLVGIIDEVQESISKVRLVTDSRLVPAVRALRGGSQQAILVRRIEGLSHALQERLDLFASEQEARVFFSFLDRLNVKIEGDKQDIYLAKGELYGSSLPLWRARGQKLKGVGFNYGWADEEGVAKDLRSGSLLQEGDLLVTSGLDGLFPAGLEVATVSTVQCLREGESSYQIEATSLVEDFQGLQSVFVLPPLIQE